MASSPSETTGGTLLLPSEPIPPCGEPVVCVPARSEARRLPALVAALDQQRDLTRPLRVVLFLNNCDDRSLEVAEQAASKAGRCDVRILERQFPPGLAHAGSARRVAMEAGAAWLDAAGAADGALLTTDADAIPAEDWVVRSLAALDAGADVAAAALMGDPREEAWFSPALRRAIDEVLAAQALAVTLEDGIDPTPGDPAPRHADSSGGGLALRLLTYRAVGGCPPLPFREDLAMVDAVRRLGGVLRRDPGIRVTVSARLRGRAPGGMADTVRRWAEMVAAGKPLVVPCPQVQLVHWRARATLRAEAAASAAALSPTLHARVVAAEVARRLPDPADWRCFKPAEEARTELEDLVNDVTAPRVAA